MALPNKSCQSQLWKYVYYQFQSKSGLLVSEEQNPTYQLLARHAYTHNKATVHQGIKLVFWVHIYNF